MSNEIQKKLASIDTFQDLETIAQKAKENISFFGRRYIHIQGCKGKLHIDALDHKIYVLKIHNKSPCEHEIDACKRIKLIIAKLYQSNDSRKLNIITWIFAQFRDFFISFNGQGYGEIIMRQERQSAGYDLH